jgi:homoserine kinase
VIHALAPASTANLGPGFDTAAAALDLWNELTVEEAGRFEVVRALDGAPRDDTHLGVRAFAVFAPVDRRRFAFVDRIPAGRGLGASAATVAVGLVAGAAAAGLEADVETLLEAGRELEGHADNLAAALLGGVCVTWANGRGPRAARIADDLPLVPVLAVTAAETNTPSSRGCLPQTVSHADAAANSAAAALLGAALATGDAELLSAAMHDRLHEPYRLDSAPLLRLLRDDLPPGARAVTLSGSGPSVVDWADGPEAERVAARVEAAVPDDTTVLPLRVAPRGAHLA